jgi:hypothetical protein
MTEAELRKMFPNASGGFLKANHGSIYENLVGRRITQKKHELKDEFNKDNYKLQDSFVECNKASALGSPAKGKKDSMGGLQERVRIKFTGHRVKPLDPDNFAGSVKDCLDFLHRSGIIEGDEPWKIILETDQKKVKHYEEEKTEIEIQYPIDYFN